MKNALLLLVSPLLLAGCAHVAAQTIPPVLTSPSPTPGFPAASPQPSFSSPPAADTIPRRLDRARGYAAVGNLTGAANELTQVRALSTDESVRDVADMMLVSIYVRLGDYARVGSMLNTSYAERNSGTERSSRRFYAMTGQMITALRARLNRYREFNVGLTDDVAPDEARADLEGMRVLLEQAVEQGRDSSNSDSTALDAAGLLEDAAALRLTLARDTRDRVEWQRTLSEARLQLVSAKPNARQVRTPANTRRPQPPVSRPTPLPATPTPTAPTSSAPLPTFPIPGPPTASATPVPSPRGPDQLPSVGKLLDRATQRISPTYPPAARIRRASGIVNVYLTVRADGTVESVRGSDGPEIFRAAAEEAAKRWKFLPTLIDGRPARVIGYITFNFTQN